MRYFEFLKEDLTVPELKTQIVSQVQDLEDFDLLDRIYQVLSHKNVKQKIENALAITTKDSNIGKIDTVINDMLSSIATIPGSTSEKLQFVESLENGTAVNTQALQMASTTFASVFSSAFAEKFFAANANFGRGVKMKGPGEFALAIMAPDILLAEKGDIMIGSQHVEVKAAERSESGGRLGEVGPVQKDAIVAHLGKIAKKYTTTPEQDNFFFKAFESVKSKSLNVSIQALHMLFPDNPSAVQACVAGVIALSFPTSMATAIGKAAARDPSGALAEIEYMKQNFEWYKDRDGFDSIMAIWFSGKRVYNFNSGNEFAALRSAGYLGSPSVSFIPSKPNEIYAQVNFTKKK